MTQPAPATVTISVDELLALQQDASALAVLAGAILEDCGIDLTRPTPTRITPLDEKVTDLAAYRSRRAVSR
ncbi:hypothetical protein [Nonomuraea sp. NPDC050643]|uniref:hypothetical protein n=1 Tax=Nonomuraea sp. NPDC050643 TaxID=3155660 RepID=UPI0033EB0CBC